MGVTFIWAVTVPTEAVASTPSSNTGNIPTEAVASIPVGEMIASLTTVTEPTLPVPAIPELGMVAAPDMLTVPTPSRA